MATKKITKIKVKQSNGSFGEAIPLGGLATNIELNNPDTPTTSQNTSVAAAIGVMSNISTVGDGSLTGAISNLNTRVAALGEGTVKSVTAGDGLNAVNGSGTTVTSITDNGTLSVDLTNPTDTEITNIFSSAGDDPDLIPSTANLISALQTSVANILGDMATVEATTTASQAYGVGKYILLNEKLYRVAVAIASGDTLVPFETGMKEGIYNLMPTTAGDEIETLNSQVSTLNYSFALKLNDYTDITSDFDNGTFSSNLTKYSPGNYIKKIYDGTTYVAVLADYNTYYGPSSINATVNTPHWTAIVLGFAAGSINSTNTTEGGFTGSEMNTWLKGDCTTIVKAAFGTAHLLSHSCLLSNGTYNSSSATHGFNWAWEEGHYTMLMTEAQLGYRAWSDLGWSTGEAKKPLQVFLNDSAMNVVWRDYGQSNRTGTIWLRDISAGGPGTLFCYAYSDGNAYNSSASVSLGRAPLIMLV